METHDLKASLIISVYKNVEFLKIVLDSLAYQTERRFEVIVSEDGESPEMDDFILNYPFQFPHQHVRHRDVGWRKNKILNEAIRSSKADWLVFIDGDCVLHPRFMEFHLKLADPAHILAGKRIKLDAATSNLLLSQSLPLDRVDAYILKNFLKLKANGSKFIEEGIFISPTGVLGGLFGGRKMRRLKGCNMSFHKKAIYSINGFDEDFVKPAVGEDADLEWRFRQAGFRLVSLRNLAVQYHLHHPECWSLQEDNMKLMSEKQARNEFICKNGLKIQP
ncbi:MAG TPA: glycosyltransferase [Cyclobacteriaceae bacterium]|nr:glycosyltransferase [Cyclobacteriaceae bacterium]